VCFQCVSGEPGLPQAGAKLSHGPIHRRDFGVAVAPVEVLDAGVHRGVFFGSPVRPVRGAEPDDYKERLVFFTDFCDEFRRLGDNYLRAFAFMDFRVGAVSAERGVNFEEIIVREVFIEAALARVDGRICLDRAEVPLAEMTRSVAGLL